MPVPGPIFIAAPTSSGAALLYEILANAPALSPVRGETALELGSAAEIEQALERRRHHHDQRLLVHDDNVAARVPFLAAAFPDAQFLIIARDPEAVIASASDPERVAGAWIELTSKLLDDLQSLDAGRWLAVGYERLLANVRQELLRVCRFLGIPLPEVNVTVTEPPPLPEGLRPLVDLTTPVADRARAFFAPRAATPYAHPPAVSFQEAFRSNSTASFPEILHDLGVSLIVTTYQSGKVVLVRAPNPSSLNTHFRSLPMPMGIAAAPEVVAIGTKREIVELRNVPWLAPRLDPPEVNDAVLVPRNVHITGDIRIHEMLFAGGELWVVNTLFSALCTIDLAHSFVPRWRPPFITALAPEDRCHLNGAAAEGDRIRYASAFSETDAAGGWRANKTGGVVIDVECGETVIRGLSMPHSPRIYGGRLWILESGRGTLATADPRSGTVETVVELPGFSRGLAFCGPFAFVGLSQVRESNVFGGIPLVDRVKERQCGVWVIDLRSGRVAAFLCFEGIVQEIFDVQVLHGVRYPEMLEITDDMVNSAYVFPA
ncbi:MAG TPA: TIGR03032 family protein [Thermoanaerobaculia bacterium]|jgi:uncharacterized protein (TIGR03032 family)